MPYLPFHKPLRESVPGRLRRERASGRAGLAVAEKGAGDAKQLEFEMERKPVEPGIEVRTRDVGNAFQPVIQRRTVDAQLAGSLGNVPRIVEEALQRLEQGGVLLPERGDAGSGGTACPPDCASGAPDCRKPRVPPTSSRGRGSGSPGAPATRTRPARRNRTGAVRPFPGRCRCAGSN